MEKLYKISLGENGVAMQNIFEITKLGEPNILFPSYKKSELTVPNEYFVSDSRRILNNIELDLNNPQSIPSENIEMMEVAGPRQKIFFDPTKVRVGIVTCGGLCPGLNNVIRSLVMSLWYIYGTRTIFGIRNGLKGFLKEYGLPPIQLTPDDVDNIHSRGGTMLGSSRGGRDRILDIVNCIMNMKLDILFIIGGDGTQRAALAISQQLRERKQNISVIGIPKTIDNDLSFVEKSFGFETAVAKAVEALTAAHTEALDSINGITVVKVMGRESGFIACHSTLASNDVNFTLIPEISFDLQGPNGFLTHLEQRVISRKHALILVAEGAGQEHLPPSNETDESGNKKLLDIGPFLVKEIKKHFNNKPYEVNVKYIDPSYIIRAAAANPNDSIYCYRLGNMAVHAAMSGRTEVLISRLHHQFVHIPISLAVSRRNVVDIYGPLWRDVIQATGQPISMKNTVEPKS